MEEQAAADGMETPATSAVDDQPVAAGDATPGDNAGSTGPGHVAQAGAGALTLGALGVVFGDIGTSPLYAFRESFEHHDLVASTSQCAWRRVARVLGVGRDHLRSSTWRW